MGEWISVPSGLPWWSFTLLLVSLPAQMLHFKALRPSVIVPLVLVLLVCPRLQATIADFATQGGNVLFNVMPDLFDRAFTHSLPS